MDVRPGTWDPSTFANTRDSVLSAIPDVRQAIRIPAGVASRGASLYRSVDTLDRG